MKIDCIYVVCHRGDVRLARILVASIRHWHPGIPIHLVKDEHPGRFTTREMETLWNVDVFQTDRRHFGWCWAKLEPLFLETGQRCLILDSDIVFAGPVLDVLEQCEEDFVVCPEDAANPRTNWVKGTYYDYEKLGLMDPVFTYPGFTFNCGQILARTGILKRDDFRDLVTWEGMLPLLKHPEVFSCGDQGIMNYLLAKMAQTNKITLGKCKFMVWPKSKEAAELDMNRVKNGAGYPFLLHWAGLQRTRFKDMVLRELLEHFESLYYQRFPFGAIKRRLEAFMFFYLAHKRKLRVRAGGTLARWKVRRQEHAIT